MDTLFKTSSEQSQRGAIVGVGVDIESVDRFRKLPYTRNVLFYKKVFSPKEIRYCRSKKESAMYFAVRFAAKEAAIKAVGRKVKNLCEFAVGRDTGGKPTLGMEGLPHLAFHVSLAHTREYAIAVVIAYSK